MTSKNSQVQEHLDFILMIILITFLIKPGSIFLHGFCNIFFIGLVYIPTKKKNCHFIAKTNKIKVWGRKFASRKIQNIVYLIFFNADVNLMPPPPGAYTVGKGGLIRRGEMHVIKVRVSKCRFIYHFKYLLFVF